MEYTDKVYLLTSREDKEREKREIETAEVTKGKTTTGEIDGI